jgi:glycosyltransferase involved in cell wall biosynthesis
MTAAAQRFCIVTPSFNTRRYIGAAIDSVLAQHYPHLDYLVMDGGSSDGTVDLLRAYGDRLRWVSQKDDGQSDAIRRGWQKTGTGDGDEILAWLNSDDTYAPGALHHVAGLFAAHPKVDVVYGQAAYIDARGKHIAPCAHIEPFSAHRLIYYSDFIVQPATFVRRRAIDAVGGINVKLNWAMDYELWVRLARHGARFLHTRRMLAHFRWLSDNKTATGGMTRIDEIQSLFAKMNLPTPAFVELERCAVMGVSAAGSLLRGRLPSAVGHLAGVVQTLMHCPRAAKSLLDPFTWNVIWTGQILRARAAASHRRWQAAELARRSELQS